MLSDTVCLISVLNLRLPYRLMHGALRFIIPLKIHENIIPLILHLFGMRTSANFAVDRPLILTFKPSEIVMCKQHNGLK